MRDFPIFTTETGVSSLTLREIPYKKAAYICIRDVQEGGLEAHISECAAFCKMAGAERVYACAEIPMDAYPYYMSLLRMTGPGGAEGEQIAQLFPVTEKTAGQWREIYNKRMAGVDNAATITAREEKTLTEGGAYFVHREGQLLGIGWLRDNTLAAVASAVPGAGETVMKTLLSLMPGEQICIEVASTNKKAIALYERLGFIAVEELARWYDVTGVQDIG